MKQVQNEPQGVIESFSSKKMMKVIAIYDIIYGLVLFVCGILFILGAFYRASLLNATNGYGVPFFIVPVLGIIFIRLSKTPQINTLILSTSGLPFYMWFYDKGDWGKYADTRIPLALFGIFILLYIKFPKIREMLIMVGAFFTVGFATLVALIVTTCMWWCK